MSKAKARRAAASSKKKAVIFVSVSAMWLPLVNKIYRMAVDTDGRVWEYRERIGWLLLDKDSVRIEALDAKDFPPDATDSKPKPRLLLGLPTKAGAEA